jgi:hypothetical protein
VTTPLHETLFNAIAHGDEKHRAWLKQAIDDHFAGRPVLRPDETSSTVETSPAPEPAPAGCEDWWHLRPYGYAPGKYTMKCPHCQVSVWDVDKRASCCKPCAIAFYESAQSEVNRSVAP